VRTFLRRTLLRLGLTGKLLIHVGWITATACVLLVSVTWLRARAVILHELRDTELVRIDVWAEKHLAASESDDHWKLAEAIELLLRDPYVVYAGLFDRAGRPIAHTGDERAYLGSHSTDLLVSLRAGPGGGASVEIPPLAGPPLPGLVSELRSGMVPSSERWKDVLSDAGLRSENLLGWIEVTMDTGPLDRLLNGILGQLVALSAAIVILALMLTWFLSRRMTEPLRMLRANAASIAGGRIDGRFDHIPRPMDEIGELATQLSVMAGRLQRDAGRTRKTAHDLKTPVTSIRAFAEILEEGGATDEERVRFLGLIRAESEKLARMLDDLARSSGEGESGEAAEERAGAGAHAGKPRVLVVSEDERLRWMLRDSFRGNGADIFEAPDADTALRLAREISPEAVVLDLLLRRGEAFLALDQLTRSSSGRSSAIIPLGIVRDGDRLVTGPIYYQSKPLDRDSFLDAVSRALGDPRPGRPSAVVADDDRFVAEAIRSLLAREGIEARVSLGGEEAWNDIRRSPPDLLVVDLIMPGIDGIELLRRLRATEETARLPVIVTTAHEIPSGAAIAWPEGPLDREALGAGLRAAVRDMIDRVRPAGPAGGRDNAEESPDLR
jgi:DNA-binding response OmpR family regulator/HAMP domain-containing protein